MFEKEADEWVKENMDCCKTDNSVNQSIAYFDEEERCCAKSAFQDGAEYGFQKGIKAKINCPIKDEWHYVKDGDLPKDEDYKWCISSNGIFYVAKYEELFLSWTNQEHKEVCCPYAWKEIIPPKESN